MRALRLLFAAVFVEWVVGFEVEVEVAAGFDDDDESGVVVLVRPVEQEEIEQVEAMEGDGEGDRAR